jgi:hypothetical protein
MTAYFSKLLLNTLILATAEGLIGVPMVGNKQYGWDKRKRLYLTQNQLHHELTDAEYKVFVKTYACEAI